MTSELKANEYISAFVSGDPKNYSYKVSNTVTRELKAVCKVRGINSILSLATREFRDD